MDVKEKQALRGIHTVVFSFLTMSSSFTLVFFTRRIG